ncbi:MAG: hypothetical protein COA42_20880 [Alteromonadaceae bacterium]|nr:MAG: hypothetical protein COA42_20880 [Alteromonadaceae bacterium]
MSEQDRRESQRINVHWKGRIILPNHSIHNITIVNVSLGGLGVHYSNAIAAGTLISIEFFIPHQRINQADRVRAKTRVTFNTILSENRGAIVGVTFMKFNGEEKNNLVEFINNTSEEE